MCYRYVVPKEERHDELFMSLNNVALLQNEERDVYPGDEAPVILLNQKMEPSVFNMRWGYRPQNNLIFNTRSESAKEKWLFKEDYLRHRCLVPAKCYFESSQDKAHYRFTKDNESMYLAGIYHRENDKMVFSILTKNPNEEIGKIHNRMPVILNKEDIFRWINPNSNPDLIVLNSISEVQYEREDR